ncbi:Smr domain containing protein [Trypanosoma cruzi]|nr:Smr domain containing protein [Trypanosoma cruzi]
MERVVQITQVQVGHIVGRGGATIKELQSTTGASVEIIDGPSVRITGDSEEKVLAALERVQAIVACQENPEYEGPVGAKLRREADALGARRSKLFDEATARRNEGDAQAAHKLVEEAKEVGRQMEEKNKEAAAAIAHYNNEGKGKGDDYFDMHGLRKEEAMTMLQFRVQRLRAKPSGTVTEFELITGAGHHSAPGKKQLLKAATVAYLQGEGIPFTEVSAGSLMATIIGTGEAAVAAPTATAVAADTAARRNEKKAAASASASKPQQKTEKRKEKGKCGGLCTVM